MVDKIIVKDGFLFLDKPTECGSFKHTILLYRYEAGDCDTFTMSDLRSEKRRRLLASALFDCREVGEVDGDVVELPNGELFSINENLR
jgi:hypothetical protein